MQMTMGTKVHENLVDPIRSLAQHEKKSVSQLIKDALHGYALRQCELYLIGLDSGVLDQVEDLALGKMRVYRDLAQSFESAYDDA